MAHEFRHLFTPFRVGGLTLKNRILSTGHAEAMAEDGKPGPRLRAYHEAKARGSAGLTIIGGSTSVHPFSPASAWNMIANHDDSVIAGYRSVAEAVRRHDCRIMSQLTHMDRGPSPTLRAGTCCWHPRRFPRRSTGKCRTISSPSRSLCHQLLGGRRPSLAPYVALTGTRGGATAVGGRQVGFAPRPDSTDAFDQASR
jgi:2,4-dienoyl-CoA reductase-like NADH-dependent reductase (Old Yellow Enzyme family)